jgi:hypothetical protein
MRTINIASCAVDSVTEPPVPPRGHQKRHD